MIHWGRPWWPWASPWRFRAESWCLSKGRWARENQVWEKRNQESSSFREERMSKKNHLPQRDFLEPLRGWRVQLLGKSHLIGCCQTGWIHRRAFWIEDLGTRTKDATLLSVDPKGWEGDLFLLYRTRQQKSLLYQQWPRGRLVRGSDQGVDVGN